MGSTTVGVIINDDTKLSIIKFRNNSDDEYSYIVQQRYCINNHVFSSLGTMNRKELETLYIAIGESLSLQEEL